MCGEKDHGMVAKTTKSKGAILKRMCKNRMLAAVLAVA
jgi:hypothetical protein